MISINSLNSRISSNLQNKVRKLTAILSDAESCVVAFSGGVDSTFLLKAAYDVLKENVLAVTSASEVLPTGELEKARGLAREIGVKHKVIQTAELADDYFIKNPIDRCYRCKTLLFQRIYEIKKELGMKVIFEGSNLDDTADYRPGMKAVREFEVRSPLKDAALSKKEIRELSRILGLPTWDKPATPCLASRFVYGLEITPERIHAVDQAENFIRNFGVPVLRVRNHGELARIEVPEDYIPQLATRERFSKIVDKLKSLGWKYVTLDLQGFRSGSLNEVLPEK